MTALSPNNVDSSTAKMLTDALADELLRTGAFRVLERSQMEKILAEQGFQLAAGCEGGECAIRMGKLLGIDRIIVGSVGSVGAAYVVTAREVDVATGEILVSAKRAQKGKLEDLLLELVPQIAKDLAGNPPHNPYLAQKEKRSSKAWLWWTAGAGVAAAGGAAAYVLLASDGGGSGGDPAAPPSGETTMKVTW